MTRFTNVGRKRTYLQATFDPSDVQIFSNVASTSSLPSPDITPSGISNGIGAASDAPAESRHKRRRKTKRNSEGKVSEESGPPADADAGHGSTKNAQVAESDKVKKAPTKPMAKVKAKRFKSAYLSLSLSVSFVGFYTSLSNQFDNGGDNSQTHPPNSRCEQCKIDQRAAVETHRGTTRAHDVLRMPRGRTRCQGLSDLRTALGRRRRRRW